jgi:hypothetical protein
MVESRVTEAKPLMEPTQPGTEGVLLKRQAPLKMSPRIEPIECEVTSVFKTRRKKVLRVNVETPTIKIVFEFPPHVASPNLLELRSGDMMSCVMTTHKMMLQNAQTNVTLNIDRALAVKYITEYAPKCYGHTQRRTSEALTSTTGRKQKCTLRPRSQSI